MDISDVGGNNGGYASVFLSELLIGEITDFSSNVAMSVNCHSLS